jgi:hypothetical protein
MHDLINRRATGSPDSFAEKLRISKSMLMINLTQLKQIGGPINYDSLSQTYYYTQPCLFKVGYELENEELNLIKGGQGIRANFIIPISLEWNLTSLSCRH